MCDAHKTPKGTARFLRRLHGKHYAIVIKEGQYAAIPCTCKKQARMTSDKVVFAASPTIALSVALGGGR